MGRDLSPCRCEGGIFTWGLSWVLYESERSHKVQSVGVVMPSTAAAWGGWQSLQQ